jgi:predicted dehydrogenase
MNHSGESRGTPLRIGILGAARIAPMALVRPARGFPDVEVRAVAARVPKRATAFAIRHRIPRVHQGYDAMLADPEIDAVYNPLPNALHAPWTIKALEAGKHVLCEKPFAGTAREAETMAEAARQSGRVLMEAFHYRYHPLFGRMRALIDEGAIGEVRRLDATFCIVLPRRSDIRFDLSLAGGALMDTGCYTVHLLRHLAGAEPTVERAHGVWTAGGVDRWMQAHLRFPGERSARLTCSIASGDLFRMSARVEGSGGTLSVLNFVAPQFYHRLTLTRGGTKRSERVVGPSSYAGQLRAFVGAVRRGHAVPTDPDDAVANMRVIDAIYAAAGRPRGA